MPEEEEPEETETSPLDDEETLVELYHEEGLTQAEIGERHGVSSSTVSHYMKKHGVETRANVVDDERLEDPEWLEEKYVGEGLTMQEIADEVGVSDGTVMRRLHKHGIETSRGAAEPDEDEGGEPEADGGPEAAADGGQEE
jgi:DNA-directed RNA polymerase specialized sigma24 family protein